MATDLNSTLLRSGIHALARAGDAPHWALGHMGATLISGAALIADPDLPTPTRQAIEMLLAGWSQRHPEWFRDSESSALGERANSVPLFEVLERHIGTLRTAGHPTIYLVLALRAFAAQPALATRGNVEGLLRLHASGMQDLPERYHGVPNYLDPLPGEAAFEVSDLASAIARSFEACEVLRPDETIGGRRYFFTGEKIHLLTHVHALQSLEQLGRPDLAKAGLAAHSRMLFLTNLAEFSNAPLPPPEALRPEDPSFWHAEGRDIWHKVKLAEASRALLPELLPEARKRAEPCLAQLWSLLAITQTGASA